MLNQLTQIRRYLHTIPEEGYKEFKTRDYICEQLHQYGIGYEIILQTAVIAFIDIKAQYTTAIRADIDGLCVTECNEVEYKSKNEGFMHACGHDGHTAAALTAAKIINENKEKLTQNVLFIFQPAEEGPGGARDIVDSGILQKYKVNSVYGTHLNPSIPQGEIAVQKGWFMAQTGEFYITIQGKSSHAANPKDGIDSILSACRLVTAVDDIKKLLKDENCSALISIGTIYGGERVNVIAGKTELSGTIRTYDTAVRNRIKNLINDKAKEIDDHLGTATHINYLDLYPAVYNDERLYDDFIKKIPQAIDAKPSMLAEDFAYYQQQVPGLFFYTGIYNKEKDFVYPLHSNKFNFDEKALLSTVDAYLKITGIK